MRAEENDTGLTEEELEEKLMEAAMEDEEERAYQRWKDKLWEQPVENQLELFTESLDKTYVRMLDKIIGLPYI
jgi:hypothetical protein